MKCFTFQRNTGQAGGVPKLDLNVGAAWALGYTGKHVTTAIMDDGEFCSRSFVCGNRTSVSIIVYAYASRNTFYN